MHIKRTTPHIGSNRQQRRASQHKAHTGSHRPEWKKVEIKQRQLKARKNDWRNK